MSLIYITGVEGSGKSTICKVLLRKGYFAVDIDEQGLSKRYFKGNWKLTESLPVSKEDSLKWYEAHEWKVKPTDLDNIKMQARSKISFACGITDNFDEIRSIFDKIICLYLSRDEIVLRLKTRTNNNFGKKNSEQQYILNKYLAYETSNRRFGAIMIDASRPLDEVLEVVLHASS